MIATTTLFIALLAYPVISSRGLSRRQDLSGVPACGQTCLITAATDKSIVGSCSMTDVPCLCNDDKFQSSVQSCVLGSCSSQDQLKMLTWATATCPSASSPPPASQQPASTAPVSSGDAGELAGLPACGQNCLIQTAGNSEIVGSCSLTDKACLCQNEKFVGTVTTCVASSCSLDDKLTMLKMSGAMCPGSPADQPAAPPATATPTPQAAPQASPPSSTQSISPASSTAVPTASSPEPLDANTTIAAPSVITCGSANSTMTTDASAGNATSAASAGNATIAASAGNAASDASTGSASIAASAGNAATNVAPTSDSSNASLQETSPATKVFCPGSWIFAFTLMVATL